jgi:hypothetical protein
MTNNTACQCRYAQNKEDQMIQNTVTESEPTTHETTDAAPLPEEQHGPQPADELTDVDDHVETEDQVTDTEDDSPDDPDVEQEEVDAAETPTPANVSEPVDELTPEQIQAEKEHRMLEDLKHYRAALQKQADVVSDRKSTWEGLKQETSDAKKSYEAAQERLHEMTMEPLAPSLFNQSDDGDVFSQKTETPQANTASTQSPKADEDEAWREATLDDLGIKGALADKLVDAELDTLGKISDYTSAGKQITDIKGIGPEKSEFISDACADYFAKHPVATKQPDDEQTTETDDSESNDSDQPGTGDVELSLVGVEDDDDDESPEADEDLVDQDDADNVEDDIDDTEDLDDDEQD